MYPFKGLGGLQKAELGIQCQYWTHALHPVPRQQIRSAEVGGGTLLREWEHNNNN